MSLIYIIKNMYKYKNLTNTFQLFWKLCYNYAKMQRFSNAYGITYVKKHHLNNVFINK